MAESGPHIPAHAGLLHHVELYVSDLARSSALWGWFLEVLGYTPYQSWEAGRSWRLGHCYIVLVQTEARFLDPPYHRRRVGLNHLAFHARSRAQVDQISEELVRRGAVILYPDRHPHAGGTYALFFEDPDRIKIELVVDESGDDVSWHDM
jgi:catechol 2,3-dioxygenase-like lactoylglutathione lyase family enzyme